MSTQKCHGSRIVNVQIHLCQATTISKIVTRTADVAIRHGDILALSDESLPVNRVTAIAITPVLNASVLVISALVKTSVNGHRSGVCKDKIG